METEILEEENSFFDTLLALYEAQDEILLQQRGGMREGGKVDLDTLEDDVWLEQFRFACSEIYQLAAALDLPQVVRCNSNGVKEDRVTALCMLLRHLSFPTRLEDIEMQFGWEKSRFSRITGVTAVLIWTRWKQLLHFDPKRLNNAKLAEFAIVIQEKGAPLDLVAAIIDGTLQRNARPVRDQRLLFNGWKRTHCLKYHALLSPDGLVIHVYGPVDGRRHDQTVFYQSGLPDILDQYFWTPTGTPLYIYGDLGYAMGAQKLRDRRRFPDG